MRNFQPFSKRKLLVIASKSNLKKGRKSHNKWEDESPYNCKKLLMQKSEIYYKKTTFEKFDHKITDEMFIQLVVITVKKDRSVKIALAARSVNNAISKNKYQMPDLENLMDKIAEIKNGKEEGEVFFTSFDMLHAYGQTVLHPNTAKHCNFQNIGGKWQVRMLSTPDFMA